MDLGAGWIAGIGVDPNVRGVGAGSVLTDYVLGVLAECQLEVIGMEVAPFSIGSAAMYARRGYVVSDITVRMRSSTAGLVSRSDSDHWRRYAYRDLHKSGLEIPPSLASRCLSISVSARSYLLFTSTVSVLRDPDLLVASPDESLEIRLLVADPSPPALLERAICAAANSARICGLGSIDIDRVLLDGEQIGCLASLGFVPIATTTRMVNDLSAYAEWIRRNGMVGRWSF